MSHFALEKEDGSVEGYFSTTIPGLIVRSTTGKSKVKRVPKAKLNSEIEKAKKNAPKPRNLAAELDAIVAENAKLKTAFEELKANGKERQDS